MRTRNRLFGAVAGLALASALSPFGVSTPASAATVTYTDNFCSQFFTMPGGAPGDVMLRCVKAMACTIVPVGSSYVVNVGTTVTLQAICTAPAAQSWTWSTGVLSPQGCPAPQPVTGDPTKATVMSSTARTCWYEVVGGDTPTQPSPKMGQARYGIAWAVPAPTCAPAATPANLGSGGGGVTLKGNCTGTATSYAWARNGTPVGTNAADSSDTAPANTTGSPVSHTYALNACNGASCTGPVSNANTVVTVAASTAVPGGCTVTISPAGGNIVPSGGGVSMGVSCTSGSPFTQFNWRKSVAGGTFAAFGTNSANQSDTLPANTGASPVTYQYDVQVCNGVGCAARTAPSTFTVSGTVSAGLCGQYTGGVEQMDLPWPPSGDTIYTPQGGGFNGNGVFVGVLSIPAGATSATQLGQINWGEYGDPPANRVVTVSTQACDFRTGWTGGFQVDSSTATAPLTWLAGQTGGIIYSIGTQTASATGQPKLQAGMTYYFNVINKDILGNNTCGTSTCNMVIQNRAPH
jgi:hypothetical protein